MSQRCAALSLYDDAAGELTDWGRRLADAYDSGGLFGDSPSADDAVCRREGADPDALDADTRRALGRAERQRVDEALPVSCPHDAYEDADVCLFHLDERERDRRDVTAADVRERFFETISDREHRADRNQKQFVAADIPRLDLEYSIVDSFDNRPIDFRYADIGALCLDDTVLSEPITFDGCTIERCSCRNTDFQGGVTFEDATLRGDSIAFDESTFRRAASFVGTAFEAGQVTFTGARFEGRVDFGGARFLVDTAAAHERKRAGDARVDVNFRRVFFGAEARFDGIEVAALADEPAEDVGLQVHFRRCRSTGRDVSFEKASFGSANVETEFGDAFGGTDPSNTIAIDEVSFKRSDFSGGDIDFSSAECAGDLVFADADLAGGTVEFINVEVAGALDMEAATFAESDVIFNDASVAETVTFAGAQFHRNDEVKFHEATFHGRCILDNVECTALKTDFSNLTVGGDATFDDVEFDCKRLTFEGAVVEGDTSIRGATLDTDRTDFADARFEEAFSAAGTVLRGDVDLEATRFLGDETDFSDVDATDATMRFEAVRTTESTAAESERSGTIDLSGAAVLDGTFTQPLETKTYYDFTDATVGDVDLALDADDGDGERLFNYFRFRETEFDGFDFSDSDYRRELKANAWRLHTVTNEDDERLSRRDRTVVGKTVDTLRKYGRLLREGSDPAFSPDVLESTYRKAKIGADENGDSDASSKFFQKELGYRRRGHGYYVWLRSDDADGSPPTLFERTKRAWFWITNSVLWLISGYGERPKRVVLSSAVVIGAFAVVYDVMWWLLGRSPPETLGGPAGSLILSAEMFTAIILGGSSVANNVIRGISYIEGFVGSLFIALFVLTITRAIRR